MTSMKVSLAQRGGMGAGINLRLPPKVVDTDLLQKPAAEELARLVAAAEAAPLVEEEKPDSARDAMTYVITIDDGGRTVLTASDSTMSPGFAALRDWIRSHAGP